MFKPLYLMMISLAVLALSSGIACQKAEVKQDAQPAAASAAAAQPDKPASTADTRVNTPSASHEIAPELVIKSVRITSPSREDVVVVPTNDNKTVSGRVWETLDLECIAADQADHSLSYAWSCDTGKLRGDGSKVVWTAPGAGGDYKVTVNVSCDKGEKASLTMDMRVKCCGN